MKHHPMMPTDPPEGPPNGDPMPTGTAPAKKKKKTK